VSSEANWDRNQKVGGKAPGDSRAMRFTPALRPSSVSRVLRPRRACQRYVSQQVNRSIAQLLAWKPDEKVDDVVVNGFVRSIRSMKANQFVSLGDGSSLAPLQALVRAENAEGYAQALSAPCVSRLTKVLMRSLQLGRWRRRPPHRLLGVFTRSWPES
jgi:hypothetical protein